MEANDRTVDHTIDARSHIDHDGSERPAYWMSYSKYEGPGKIADGRGFIISIVFDGATNNDFSANRIVIVARKNELLNNVKIKDCLDPRRYNVKRVNPTSHRALLSRNRDMDESGKRSLESVSRGSNGASIALCTVVFELVENARQYISPDVMMHLVLLSEQPSKYALRILYDHTRAWTSTHGSTVLFLESSHSLQVQSRSHWQLNTIYRFVDFSGIPAHSIRILPLPKDRLPFTHLPPVILICVAQHAFGDRNVGWRRGLMSFGLVCKAWTSLLDLFFRNFYNPRSLDLDQADASKVARSLERRPERGALMEKFSPYDYRLHFLSSADDWNTFWQSQSTILRLATTVKDLHLSCTHQSLFDDFVATLCLLKKVQNFRVSGAPSACSTAEASSGLRSLDITDIQSIISQWIHLRSLNLTNWNPLVDTHTISQPSEVLVATERSEATQLMCKIEVLTLHNGILTGSQLLAFASPIHPISSLHTVDICNIQGLKNRDLLAFLSQIAASLKSLAIYGCTISRNLNEEYALDTTISKMVHIHSLKIDGDIATALVLARKIRREKGDCQKKDSITITHSRSMELRSIVEALEICYWDSVYISWGGEIDDTLLGKALNVTESRGIKFTLAVFARPVE